MKITVTIPQISCSTCEQTSYIKLGVLVNTKACDPEFLQRFPDSGLMALDSEGVVWRILQADRPKGWSAGKANKADLLIGVCPNCADKENVPEPIFEKPVFLENAPTTARHISEPSKEIEKPVTLPNELPNNNFLRPENVRHNVQNIKPVVSSAPNSITIPCRPINTKSDLSPLRPNPVSKTMLETRPAQPIVSVPPPRENRPARPWRRSRQEQQAPQAPPTKLDENTATTPTPPTPATQATKLILNPTASVATSITTTTQHAPCKIWSTPNIQQAKVEQFRPTTILLQQPTAVVKTQAPIYSSSSPPVKMDWQPSPIVVAKSAVSTKPTGNNSEIVKVVPMEVDDQGQPVVPKISKTL